MTIICKHPDWQAEVSCGPVRPLEADLIKPPPQQQPPGSEQPTTLLSSSQLLSFVIVLNIPAQSFADGLIDLFTHFIGLLCADKKEGAKTRSPPS